MNAKIFFICYLSAVSLLLLGCSKSIEVSSVRLSESEISLGIDETTTIVAVVEPSNADYDIIKWSSSDPLVASVSDGMIWAHKVGMTQITASAGGVTSKACVIKVDVIHVMSVTLDKVSEELTEGDELVLRAEVLPSGAANKGVTWSSSDPSVATVSNGVVHAISAGTVVITVRTEDKGLSSSCQLTVKKKIIPVTGISISATTISLTEGESKTLEAEISPKNATETGISWSSSDESVARVDSSSGEVTAVSPGTASITCTTTDGSHTATCTVTVEAAVVAVSGVALDIERKTLTEGESFTLKATVSPLDATNQGVIWSSSDESVASVDKETGEITGKSPGEAVITCKTKDGGKTATCAVTIIASKVAVTGVSINWSTLSMTVGEAKTLTATIVPSNATDKTVTWSSSNTSVAAVSSSGVVTAKAVGSATITCTSNDNSKRATCTVTVSNATISVTGVSLNRTALTLTVGDVQTLVATVTPSNATDISVVWSSSNSSVATVSSSGVVSAQSPGTATISCVTNSGSKMATCTVTVKQETGEEINIQSISFIPQTTINGLPGFITTSCYYYPLRGNNVDSINEKWVATQGGKEQIPLNSIVQYHVNGSNVALDDTFDYSFIYKDTPSYSMLPVFKGFSDGVLSLSVTVNGYPATENDNTLFALQISKGNFSIVSDYATLKAKEFGDFRIADPMAVSRMCKNLDDEHYRRGTVGISNPDAEDVYLPNKQVWNMNNSLEEAHNYCDTSVTYDGVLDLKTITALHYVIDGDEYEMDAYTMRTLGFGFVYETVKNYKIGTPVIDQANYAVLQEGVFNAKSYYSNSLDAIGHTPIIRVKLMHGNDIVQVAYIKIFITESGITNPSFELIPRRDAKDDGENIFRFSDGGDCLMTTFRDMNEIIYGGMGMTKYQFHALYDNIVIAPRDNPIGTVSDVLMDSASSAHLISWTLDAEELKAYAGKEVSITARYFSSYNQNLYVDILLTATVSKGQ